jgi:hypothetical protein
MRTLSRWRRQHIGNGRLRAGSVVRRSPRTGRRPVFEALESRRLLEVTINELPIPTAGSTPEEGQRWPR